MLNLIKERLGVKDAYAEGYKDGLKSRERIITFEDGYEYRMKDERELPKEDTHNLRSYLQDSRFESLKKWMLYQAMRHYEDARDQDKERRFLFDEIGRFCENCVQSWEIMKLADKKPPTNEWDG